jgi:adenylyl-sulfate kinase
VMSQRPRPKAEESDHVQHARQSERCALPSARQCHLLHLRKVTCTLARGERGATSRFEQRKRSAAVGSIACGVGVGGASVFLVAGWWFGDEHEVIVTAVKLSTQASVPSQGKNLHWHRAAVAAAERAQQKAQEPYVLWFTGLSGAGKSTLANLVDRQLLSLGHHSYLLDGDNVRHGLNRDLGFSDADRVENIRRVAEVAKLMVDAGLITLAAFISPFRAERRVARELFGAGRFIEIYVHAPLEVCMARDPKGLYRRAKQGQLERFTGIDSPYEPPEAPELTLDTAGNGAEELADVVIDWLRARQMGAAHR